MIRCAYIIFRRFAKKKKVKKYCRRAGIFGHAIDIHIAADRVCTVRVSESSATGQYVVS